MTPTPASPNLLDDKSRQQPATSPRRPTRRVLRSIRTAAIVVAVAFFVLSWTTRSSNPNPYIALRESTPIRSLLSLIQSTSAILDGERDNRINILLLGMGGVGHDGPLLADTILIASLDPTEGRPTLISIPRDLLLPMSGGDFEKANAIHAYAEDTDDRGPEAIREALSSVLDIDIPYHIRVDFAGFVGLIDELDGVDVLVERMLNDPEYPILGREDAEPYESRFEHLVIPAGSQHLDGDLALKYVRSRHALGVEGSDFARTHRQQLLLAAIRDRVDERGGLTNPRQLLALLKLWRNHVETNLSSRELIHLAQLMQSINQDTIAHIVFTDAPDGDLVAGRYNGSYVLRPIGGSYDILRDRVQSAFDPERAVAITPARRTVAIWNGTNVAGLAGRTAELLDETKFRVISITNAPRRTVEQTILYSGTTVPKDIIDALTEKLNAVHATTFPAVGTMTDNPPDILIVLGTSSITVGQRVTTEVDNTGGMTDTIPVTLQNETPGNESLKN
ncbi:MAG: LCP family protein [Candidatus Uhrbacteria bacterium]